MKLLQALFFVSCVLVCPRHSFTQAARQELQLLDSLGELHFYQEEPDSSMFYFRRLVEQARLAGDTAAQLEAYNWLFYLNIAYGGSDSLEAYLGKMIPLAEKLDGQTARNADILSSFWNSRSYYHDQRGEFFEKIEGDKNALRYYERLPDADSSELAVLYQNLGTALEQTGDYFQANTYSRKALELLRPSSSRTHIQLDSLKILNSIGAQLAYLRRYEEAERFFQQGRQLAETLGNSTDEEARSTAALYYVQWGSNHYHQEAYQAADQMYERAAAIFSRLQEVNSDILLLFRRYRARNALAQGNDREAEKLTIRSLELISDRYSRRLQQKGAFQELAGDIYLAQKKYPAAVSAYQSALQSLCPGFTASAPDQNPTLAEMAFSKNDLLRILRKKGTALKSNGRQGPALAAYQLAVAVFHAIREDFVTEDARLFLSEQTAPLFEQAIDLAVELGQTGLALQLVEHNKALLLQEALKDEEAYRLAGVPAELAERVHQLQIQHSYWEKIRFEHQIGANSQKLQEAQNKLFDIKRQRDLIMEKIRLEFPKFFELKFEKDVISQADINQRLLLPGKALIEYYIGEEKIFVFGLNRDGLLVRTTEKDTAFDDRINALIQAIRRETPLTPGEYARQAHAFFVRYLAPVLEGFTSPVSELYLIPDGIFSYIPFEALLTEAAAEPAYSTFPYLLKSYRCSYAYSSVLLMRATFSVGRSGRSFVGFAPEFGTQGALQPLRYNVEAVDAIRQLTGGISYTRSAATRANFWSPSATPLILHLSTHAQLDDQDPMGSKIYLADGDISTGEVYNLPYSCRLVVLSACETGSGKFYSGEGIMSLARAFLQSGSNSVVTSLWKVDDRSTSELMIRFYEHLIDGRSQDQALQQAKLDFLQSKESESLHHPYYWAAFVHIGDAGAISFPTRRSAWRYGVPALLVLGLYLYFRKFRLPV